MPSIINLIKKVLAKANPGKFFNKLENTTVDQKDVIHSNPNSPVRFDILANIIKSGTDETNVVLTGNSKDIYSLQTILGVRKSFLDIKKNPKNPKTTASIDFINDIKRKAKEFGATSVGFTRIDSSEIFKDKAILFDNAIVLTMEMGKDAINKAPSVETKNEIFKIYRDLGVVTIKLANYLRKNGYSAHAGHPLGGLSLYPKIGQKAGLGWHGRHGLLISPGVGPRQRVAVVYTSINNLPFVKENKHSWIEEFCKTCGRCIKTCPGKAIYDKQIIHENGIITSIDTEKCFPEFKSKYGCTVCIKECVFNNFDFDKIKQKFQKTK